MPTPTDINSQIAFRKGWTWARTADFTWDILTHWRNPEGKPAVRPNYVGTVEGISTLLRELQEKKVEEGAIQYDWAVRWSALFQIWDVWAEDAYNTGERLVTAAATKEAGLGEAIGAAWLSQHGGGDHQCQGLIAHSTDSASAT